MLSQQLSQRLLQKLSPQQIQLMKLLQIPTVSLEQRIKEELEQNPALEEGDELGDSVSDYEMEGEYDDDYDSDYSAENDAEKPEEDFGNEFEEVPMANDEIQLDDYIQDYIDDDVASYKLAADYGDEEEKDTPHSVENSFHEHLLEQLGLVMLAPEQHRVAAQIIGSIDDDGYLRREVDAITDDLSFREGISTTDDEVERLLKVVQRFEPPGIAARNLQECLSLQLERRALTEPNNADLASIKIAYKIIDKYFNEFTKKHFDKLQRSLDVTDKQLKDAVAQILRLNPKPASGYATGNRSLQVIIPDFIVTATSAGELELALNSRNAPDLHISDQYKDMLRAYSIGAKKDRKEKDAVSFIKQKIDAAKWFIDAIKQRQQTMYKTMLAILQYQEEYFITGDDKKLRPMILKDIAEMTELDISTVSRVANSKYVQTEYGVKSLKAFFSESLQTESGEEVSTLEVKNILQEMISNESKSVPLSDEKLMEILTERGYAIARRTVAKYREQLNIPVARLRKEL